MFVFIIVVFSLLLICSNVGNSSDWMYRKSKGAQRGGENDE